MTDEEMRSEALKLERSEWALLALFACIILGLLWFVGCRIVPFEPYRSYDYEAVPETVCVGDTVTLEAERSVDGAHRVEGLRYDSEWVPAGGQPGGYPPGLAQDAEDGDLPLSPGPRERVVSRAPRTVPTVTGEWALVTRYAVYGSVGGVGREQELTVRTDRGVTVEGENSAFCEGRTPEERGGVVVGG